MRASRAEIVGHPDGHPGKDMRNETRDPKDLTSSRLQSELYRELRKQPGRPDTYYSFRSLPGVASLFFPVEPECSHHPSADSHQRLPA